MQGKPHQLYCGKIITSSYNTCLNWKFILLKTCYMCFLVPPKKKEKGLDAQQNLGNSRVLCLLLLLKLIKHFSHFLLGMANSSISWDKLTEERDFLQRCNLLCICIYIFHHICIYAFFFYHLRLVGFFHYIWFMVSFD